MVYRECQERIFKEKFKIREVLVRIYIQMKNKTSAGTCMHLRSSSGLSECDSNCKEKRKRQNQAVKGPQRAWSGGCRHRSMHPWDINSVGSSDIASLKIPSCVWCWHSLFWTIMNDVILVAPTVGCLKVFKVKSCENEHFSYFYEKNDVNKKYESCLRSLGTGLHF